MAAIHHFISPFRKREMKEGFSQRRGVSFNQHFRKNCPFWLAVSTTKYENDFALAGEKSSERIWCHEPE
jgi:hypothetical protein